MAISENKTRISLLIEKSDKAKLEELGKRENRSFSNCITTAIKEYIANHYDTDDKN